MKTGILVALVCCAANVLCSSPPGFKVSGTAILDKNGNKFVMRGINHPHTWYKNDMEAAISSMAATGSNVIRIVLSNGDKYYKDSAESVREILEVCARNNLIVILEEHDATGLNDFESLDSAANYWLELAPVLKGLEDRVIINIANEWHSSMDSSSWAEGYKAVIPKLRDAGLSHLIIVDTAGYGQTAAAIVQKGREVFEADPLHNVAFSIHMYEVAAANEAVVRKNIDDTLAIGVPVIIGEFSRINGGNPVAYKDILEYTSERNVGWVAWTWYGSDPTDNMDIINGLGGELTPFGREIIDGKYGIRATVKPATIW